jgi:hypothetical protein
MSEVQDKLYEVKLEDVSTWLGDAKYVHAPWLLEPRNFKDPRRSAEFLVNFEVGLSTWVGDAKHHHSFLSFPTFQTTMAKLKSMLI